MAHVLSETADWMDRDRLAQEIADRDLYRQRSGGPPPSDQLRLRARKYGHLFEGSDKAYTRIRLRSSAPSVSPAPTSQTAKPPPQRPAVDRQPRSRHEGAGKDAAAAARRRRQAAARAYKPARIRLLLIAEAPPSAPDRYFYFTHVAKQDSLFRHVARGLLAIEPTRDNKAELLAQLRDAGVFLIDVRDEPVDGTSLQDSVDDLVHRVIELAPEKIILIKATVYDAAFAALFEAGLPVVDERVPFPGSGQQKRFESAFVRAIGA